jgi:hypothetical protein
VASVCPEIKIPGPITNSIRGFPFFILAGSEVPGTVPVPGFTYDQAGLLTFGSNYRLRLPKDKITFSGIFAVLVPDYSGGPVPGFHGVPY